MMIVDHNLLTQVQHCFIEKNWTMVTAESCTAGGVAYACTQTAGSSRWFLGGVVAYSNAVKQHLLAVESTLLAEYGAVSEPVVLAMAHGAQAMFDSDWAVSTSGVAGPSGGSDAKPVGMVCFAWVYRQHFALSVTEHFAGNRQQVREKSIAFALSHLLSIQEKIST